MEIIAPGSYVSEFTKNTLQQFGWTPEDPIPANFGELMEKIRARTPVSKLTGVLVDAAFMSADDVSAVKALLAEAKAEFERRKSGAELAAKTANMLPEAAALFTKLSAQQKSNAGDGVQIVDDRATAVDPAPPTEPIAAQAPAELPDDGTALPTIPDAPLAPAFCPRCDWDLRQKYEVETTPADREAFMVSILGDKRFEKSFSVFNDQYEVTFRTLLAEENKTIHRQLTIDQKNGEFNSDTEWFLRFFEYRLACSISRVLVDGKPAAEIPEMTELGKQLLPAEEPADLAKEPLLRMYTYVIKDLLKGEIKRRLVSKHFREFQRMYESLEAMALEPNFW